MGEIRSTLDIIMEKARGVTVTEEDKAEFTRREVEGKVRGYLQKTLDGLDDVEGLKAELEALCAERRELARAALRKECLGRLTLEGDNTLLLSILTYAAGLDIRPIEDLMKRFKEELDARRIRQESALRSRLERRGISGSAVIPNLKADPDWTRYLADVDNRFRQELADLRLDS